MEPPTPENVSSLLLQSLGEHIDGDDFEARCQDGASAPLYVQILGTVIFVVVWPFIVLDMRWFPLGRPAAALVGAGFMILSHVITQQEVYWVESELGNMKTIYLLVGMMILSYYFDREGILRLISLWIFGAKKPFKHILWKVCLLSAFMSALITNDATCLVITPLLLLEFKKQGRSQRELLPLCLGIATSANIGSAATIFGNPQNAFIASAAGVSLLEFFMALLPAALIGTAASIGLLYLFFWRTVFEKYDVAADEAEREAGMQGGNRNYTIPGTLAEERESVALSYDQSNDPYLSSRIAAERDGMYSHERNPHSGSYQRLPHSRSRHSIGRGTSPYPHSKQSHLKAPEIRVDNETQPIVQNGKKKRLSDVTESVSDNDLEEDMVRVKSLKERSWRERLFLIWLGFVTFLVIALLAIPPPPLVSFQFDLGLVPMGAAIFTMLVDTILNKTYSHDAMLKIDWTIILMFMGLFIWLEGFQNTCYIELVFNKLAPYMNLYKIEGVLLFTVVVIIGSNIFSNVPLVILIVDRIANLCGDDPCEGPLGGLLLAWISTIAGNFTLIGSVANLIVAEKARSTVDYRISFWNYFKFGGISTTVVLFGMLPVVYFVGKLA